MKLALCFSGQPRFVEECSSLILKNVIQDYDVDVFAHLWMDEELQNKPYKYGGDGGWEHQRIKSNADEIFRDIYHPVSIVTESSRTFKDFELESDFELSERKYWSGGLEERTKLYV